MTTSTSWQNWAGNQACRPSRVVRARDVEQIQEVVAEAGRQGRSVRVVGSGHSFTPLVCTEDTILDIGGLTGVIDADVDANRALVWAGTTIRDLGAPLWNAGLSLSNQGDIDMQTIAGAMGTATHGSGLRFTSLSGVVRSVEYVAADGTLATMNTSDPHFAAMCTATGTLGVFTKVELAVSPAYQIVERIEYWPFDEIRERWAAECATRRHFSYFWGPAPGSLELYGMDSPPDGMVDGCYVKIYDEAPPGHVLTDAQVAAGCTIAPAYIAYPDDFDTPFFELEYFVPFTVAPAAVEAVRDTMLRFSDQRFPLEVRTVAAEDGWLSPMYGRDSVSISVSGTPGSDYWPFLRAVDATLAPFDARPHWGKLNCFDRQRFRDAYPRFDDFVEYRRSADPHGVFLNDYTREILG
jgi:FAD/FMN-containing dehydrogenase